MKIIALYLPQYHVIKENNKWWGQGYTEWSAVKRAYPLFKGHNQPRIPLNENYYDLADENANAWKWQSELAINYGIYGFCIYHYWFKGKQLLEKPMEILLNHPEIKINYCICWANESWTKTWYGLEKEVLMLQEYGEKKDWEQHFNYMLKFFKDDRYIKIDNKPVVNIYKSTNIEKLEDMLKCWRTLALQNGFNGLHIVVSNNSQDYEIRSHLIDAYYDFEPGYSTKNDRKVYEALIYNFDILTRTLYNKLFNKKFLERKVDIRKIYKRICKRAEKTSLSKKTIYPGLFPMWDNTPRRDYKGTVYINESPELFYKTLKSVSEKVKTDGFIYINAWNEWGEGCYLEPDTINKYAYLEAIKKVVNLSDSINKE